MTYDKEVKDAIRSTGLVTNEQAWLCSDAVMKLPVWDRVLHLENTLRLIALGHGCPSALAEEALKP